MAMKQLRRSFLYETENSYRRGLHSCEDSDGCLVGCNTVYCAGWIETFLICVLWPPCPEAQCHHTVDHKLKVPRVGQ